MSNKGVEIRYGDVAPEAKENFVPVASESKFGERYKTELTRYNLNFPHYANPCELYQTVLDGKAKAFPSIPESSNIGLWSERMSDDAGNFNNPIELELSAEGQYTSQGITLKFDEYNNIFATRLKIKWIRITNEEVTNLDEKEFYPDSSSFFCRNFVQNYNKLIITFYSLNMPKNRLKLCVIDYGYGTIFYGNELRNTKLIQEIDPISTQIPINTADFTLDSKSDMEYSFQTKQPLSIYFNGKLKTTAFVKNSKRKAKFLWDVQCEDYIGLMDGVSFFGGIYNGKNAYDLCEEIFKTAKVPYKINQSLKEVSVYGYIPLTTCRNALMQVAFAVQNMVDSNGREYVELFESDNEVKQTIPLNRIKQGQNFVMDETVTSVEVTVHSYKSITESVDAYNASESGTGEEIFVKFSEPLHDLSITNGSILQSGSNYAIINANSGCVLRGQKYEHTTQIRRKDNPLVLATEIEKIISIENATLVSIYNIDNIIEKCFNWLIKTKTTNCKIVEGKHVQYGNYIKYGQKKYGTFKYGGKHSNIVTYDEPVNVGENINVETEYSGIVSGKVIKQRFNLNGNIIIKEVELK